MEPQVIEYISNPTKFKEDLEVAILEGKATGETILKSIENAVNGRKSSDIGDPERRTINEIKESIIRVKTAPEMNLIATGDLNSEKILKELDISAVEKYDPDNPNLPPKVRARVDKLAQKGEVPGIFYDKITNKIFVDENITDEAVIRAGIAREWKISEDLKTGKGKENDEGQLKATVAGELAYDDMMKRAREGKTGSISTGKLNEAVMDVDSEVTSDKTIVPEKYIKDRTIKDESKVNKAFADVFGKKYANFSLKKYNDNINLTSPYISEYVAKMNYYYMQANMHVTLEEFNRDRRNYRRIPNNEAVLHNIRNGKIYIGEDVNVKYVNNNNGKEVVLDSKGNLVNDYYNRGTFNTVTYINDKDEDKTKHGRDVIYWLNWGTGPDDKSSIRKRIELSLVGKVVSDNYEDIKIWAISRGYRSIGLKEAMEYTSNRLFLDDFKNQLNNLLKFNPEQIAPRIMDLR